MEQKSNKQLIEDITEHMKLYQYARNTDDIAVASASIIIGIVELCKVLYDKQERAEKYIKMKYPKVYIEVYGQETNNQ